MVFEDLFCACFFRLGWERIWLQDLNNKAKIRDNSWENWYSQLGEKVDENRITNEIDSSLGIKHMIYLTVVTSVRCYVTSLMSQCYEIAVWFLHFRYTQNQPNCHKWKNHYQTFSKLTTMLWKSKRKSCTNFRRISWQQPVNLSTASTTHCASTIHLANPAHTKLKISLNHSEIEIEVIFLTVFRNNVQQILTSFIHCLIKQLRENYSNTKCFLVTWTGWNSIRLFSKMFKKQNVKTIQ